jgi:hypothetical protein
MDENFQKCVRKLFVRRGESRNRHLVSDEIRLEIVLPPSAGLSEKMTAKAGKVRGVVHGGNMATGVKPSGVRASASKAVAVLPFGRAPPPGVPGCGALAGAWPCATLEDEGDIKALMPTPTAAPTAAAATRSLSGARSWGTGARYLKSIL